MRPAGAGATPALTLAQARALHLAAQGLLHAPRGKATVPGLLQAIERMQMLQIDTIHVVARSPFLVLFSRLGPYPTGWLEELLAAGRLAECWAHEACFVRAEDYPLHCAARPSRTGHWAMRRARRVQQQYPVAMREVLERVRLHGPVRAVDFQRTRPARSGWWDWKPEKNALEAWFALGQLMVARREHFHRVYDLTERVQARHPAVGRGPQSAAAARQAMLLRSVRALGIAKAAWVADYFRLPQVVRAELDGLCARGELLPVRVKGWTQAAYVHADHAALLAQVASGGLRASHTTLLSPFDPVVWHRRRARELFNFDYRLECYLPAARRRYGYYALPILHRGRLVGRLVAKAHRPQKHFEVRSVHLEAGVEPSAALVRPLARAIVRCARWHDTPEVSVQRACPAVLTGLLRQACSAAS